MKSKEIEQLPVNRELLNLISPQHVSLKPQRAEIGDYLSKFQYIIGYPSSVNLGWLMSLKDIQNTSVSLVITPIDDIQSYIEGISKGITTDKNTYNTTQDEALKNAAEFKIKSAQKIIDDIQRDNIPYINLSFLLKTNGENEQNFNDNVRTVKNKVAAMGLKLRVPSYLTEKAFRQSAPFDSYYKDITQISNKNMSLKALFCGLPFSGSSFIDEQGYYIGTDEDGRMIALSLFYKGGDRTNSNVVITGASGSGKSYLAKKLMLNEWLNRNKAGGIRSRVRISTTL